MNILLILILAILLIYYTINLCKCNKIKENFVSDLPPMICLGTTCIGEEELFNLINSKNITTPPPMKQICLEDVCIDKVGLNNLLNQQTTTPSPITTMIPEIIPSINNLPSSINKAVDNDTGKEYNIIYSSMEQDLKTLSIFELKKDPTNATANIPVKYEFGIAYIPTYQKDEKSPIQRNRKLITNINYKLPESPFFVIYDMNKKPIIVFFPKSPIMVN